MPYACGSCHRVFAEPKEELDSFGHAFGIERCWRPVCPHCGSTAIELPVLCPKCGDWMAPHRPLCPDCTEDLLDRVNGFFAALTGAELAQFDMWMDGNSIRDRKKWRPDQ